MLQCHVGRATSWMNDATSEDRCVSLIQTNQGPAVESRNATRSRTTIHRADARSSRQNHFKMVRGRQCFGHVLVVFSEWSELLTLIFTMWKITSSMILTTWKTYNLPYPVNNVCAGFTRRLKWRNLMTRNMFIPGHVHFEFKLSRVISVDHGLLTGDFRFSGFSIPILPNPKKCNSIFSEVLKLRHPQLQETVFLKICFIVNMEFWKYRFPNLWISWFWDFSEPGFSKMWISEFLIVGISEHLDFSKYGFLKIWIYRILDIWKWIPECLDFMIVLFLKRWIS